MTDEEKREAEQAYLMGMARMCHRRGYPNLGRSYEIAAGLYLPSELRRDTLATCRVQPENVPAELMAS